MQYLIEGADKETGEDRTVIIDADNEADLRAKIKAMGILVSHAKLWNAPAAPPVAVNYATPAPTHIVSSARPRIPGYFGLQFASLILGISATLFYAIAVLAFIASISSTRNFNSPYAGVGVLVQGMVIISLLAAGGIQHGLSAACTALRDIARNSFTK